MGKVWQEGRVPSAACTLPNELAAALTIVVLAIVYAVGGGTDRKSTTGDEDDWRE